MKVEKMAELKCAVDTCVYNNSECCCKGDIMVGGMRALSCEETCCESFREKKGDRATNEAKHPSRTISIDCEAVKCIYNSNYKCLADHVDIRGCKAADCRETSCATFKER